MEQKIISHGFVKHPEGAPCKICDRMAKAHSKSEAKRVEAVMAPIAEGSDPVNATVVVQEKPVRTFTEEQVAGMLEEVQKTTTRRIFQTLYDLLEKKQNDLSFPALRKIELEQLEQSYDNDSQSPSGE